MLCSTVAWDGGGGNDLSWGNPLNWAGDVVPASTDTVDFSGGTGIWSVRINTGDSFTAAGLASGAAAQHVAINILPGARFELTGDASEIATGGILQFGGTFAVDGTLTIDPQAAYTWNGGGIVGGGTIVDGGPLSSFAAGSGDRRTLAATLRVTQNAYRLVDTLYLGDDQHAGDFQLAGINSALGDGSVLPGGAAGGSLTIAWATTKTSAGSFTVAAGVTLQLQDYLSVSGGTFSADRVETPTADSSRTSLSGNVSIRNGGRLWHCSLSDGVSLAGVFDVYEVVLIGDGTVGGGTFVQTRPGYGVLVSNSPPLWSSTDVMPGVTVRIATYGDLPFSTSNPPKFGGTISNGGTLSYVNLSTIRFTDAEGDVGNFVNDVGASVNITPGSHFLTPGASDGAVVTFDNYGLMNVNAAGNASTVVANLGTNVRVVNEKGATIKVLGGSFDLGVDPASEPGLLSDGTWSIAAGASLALPEPIVTNRAVVTVGAGASGFASLSRNEGTLTFAASPTLALAPVGGVLTNTGTLTFGTIAQLTIDGAVNNSGTLTLGSATHLSTTGSITNSASFTLGATDQLTIGGSLINSAGTLALADGTVAASAFSNGSSATVTMTFMTAATTPLIRCTGGAATLAGTLNVTGGTATEQPTDVQTVVSADGGVSGTFTLKQSSGVLGRSLALGYTANLATLRVKPAAPTLPTLTTATDTGVSTTDRITNAQTLSFRSSSTDAGVIELWLDGVLYNSIDRAASGAAQFDVTNLAEGVHKFFSRRIDADGDVTVSSTTSVTVDRTRPKLSTLAFQYLTRPEFAPTFDEPVYNQTGATIAVTPLSGGGSAMTATYNATRGTWTFANPGPIADGDYTAVFADAGTDAAGNLAIGNSTSFFVMAGDADHNRQVDFADLLRLASHYGVTLGGTYAQGDFNYSGTVDFADLLILARQYGKSLPAPALPQAVANGDLSGLTRESPRRRTSPAMSVEI